MTEIARIPLVFYRALSGAEPVRAWLKAMARDDRLVIGADLMRVQYRWPVGMPLCRPMGGGLWEVRSQLAGGRTARVFMCFQDGVLYALHGFIKKTQKTPTTDLELARARMKDVRNG